MLRRYFTVRPEELTGNQEVLTKHSEFGLYRNILGDRYLTFHEWAGELKRYMDSQDRPMINEGELRTAVLRLLEEGLIGMTGQEYTPYRPVVQFKKLDERAQVPTYSNSGDAGADVRVLPNNEAERIEGEFLKKRVSGDSCNGQWIINVGETRMLPLGFSIALPEGYEMQVRSRSGLAKRGIVVANSPGTIDSGYRGPCMVLLHNQSGEPYVIEPGERIAQFVLKMAPQASFEVVEELDSTERGEGGFGSTGRT